MTYEMKSTNLTMADRSKYAEWVDIFTTDGVFPQNTDTNVLVIPHVLVCKYLFTQTLGEAGWPNP